MGVAVAAVERQQWIGSFTDWAAQCSADGSWPKRWGVALPQQWTGNHGVGRSALRCWELAGPALRGCGTFGDAAVEMHPRGVGRSALRRRELAGSALRGCGTGGDAGSDGRRAKSVAMCARACARVSVCAGVCVCVCVCVCVIQVCLPWLTIRYMVHGGGRWCHDTYRVIGSRLTTFAGAQLRAKRWAQAVSAVPTYGSAGFRFVDSIFFCAVVLEKLT